MTVCDAQVNWWGVVVVGFFGGCFLFFKSCPVQIHEMMKCVECVVK